VGQRSGFLLQARDGIFGTDFTQQVKGLGIQEVLGGPRTPQQRAYVERVIDTIRRECLDHV
jgi:putative transposase